MLSTYFLCTSSSFTSERYVGSFLELFSEITITFVFCDTHKSSVILLGCAQLDFCYYLLYVMSLHIIPVLLTKLSVLSPQNIIVQFIVIVLFIHLYFLSRVQFLGKLFFWVQFNSVYKQKFGFGYKWLSYGKNCKHS